MATINNSFLTDESTYQSYFYEKILGNDSGLRIDRSTDGYIDGTIFEHKQNVISYGRSKALSQALIYLARFNRDGMPIPKNIMLVSQDEQKVYLYNSNDYMDIINDISTYATMQASTGIEGFKEKHEPEVITYDLNNIPSCKKLSDTLSKKPEYSKVDITIHNVYGWATYFYSVSAKPKKVEFFKEIKKPKNDLKDFINPWTGEEKDFSLIMDLLNDPMQQKKLGAFYTPPLYAKKAVELVRKAIANVPEGNDYIILDRCAGTGALEYELSDEELSHVIVNTYELKEWHALKDRLGKLVRCVIPPIPVNENEYPDYDKDTGFLSGANVLDKDFLERKEIMKYVNDPKCNVILFENPPYKDITGKDKTTDKIKPYLYDEFVAAGTDHAAHRELANLFIWSGVKYYLTKPNDSYVLFAPVKYFKSCDFINNNFVFVDGFAFNRKHFHASPSVVSCVLWQNNGETNNEIDKIKLKTYDIDEDNKLLYIKDITIKKVKNNFSNYNPAVKKYPKDEDSEVYVEYKTGVQSISKINKKAIYNDNIIGYLRATSYNLSGFSGCLTRTITKDALEQCYGYYLRKDYFLEKLPLFVAKSFPENEWYEKEIYFTTSDGGLKYTTDNDFLKKCLIWTCLTGKNKSCSFIGTDGRTYKNELCFDGKNTEAYKKLNSLIKNNGVKLTDFEQELINEFNELINELKSKDKKTKKNKYEEYNSIYTYGIYQIDNEINITIVIGYDKNGNEKTGHKYGDLNQRLTEFKKKVQKYYNECLIEDLFKYELLK